MNHKGKFDKIWLPKVKIYLHQKLQLKGKPTE